MQWSVKIVLDFTETYYADTLNRVLIPDLLEVPLGMVFKQEVVDKNLIFYVSHENLKRVKSTIDELLGQCELILELVDKSW